MGKEIKTLSCSGHKRLKLIAVIIGSSFIMTGCSLPVKTISAGTAVSEITDMASSGYNTPTEISWMSDKEILQTSVTVTEYSDQAPEINIDQNIASLVPESDICTLYYFNISADRYDFPVMVTDDKGKKFDFNGREFDTAVYPIGEGWYCFNMPNSCDSCQIKVGNTYFK